MCEDLWNEMDKVTELWRILEDNIRPFPFQSKSSKLSIGRLGDRYRILYDDKPLEQCCLSSRVEFIKQIPDFIREVEIEYERLLVQAELRVAELNRLINMKGWNKNV